MALPSPLMSSLPRKLRVALTPGANQRERWGLPLRSSRPVTRLMESWLMLWRLTAQSIMQLLLPIIQLNMQSLLPIMQLTLQLLPPTMPQPLPIMQFIMPQCCPLTPRLTTLQSHRIMPLMPQSLVPTQHQLCPTLQLTLDSLIMELTMQLLLFTQRHTMQ